MQTTSGYTCTPTLECTKCLHNTHNSVKINVAWLTQLVERQFAVQEVEGSSS